MYCQQRLCAGLIGEHHDGIYGEVGESGRFAAAKHVRPAHSAKAALLIAIACGRSALWPSRSISLALIAILRYGCAGGGI